MAMVSAVVLVFLFGAVQLSAKPAFKELEANNAFEDKPFTSGIHRIHHCKSTITSEGGYETARELEHEGFMCMINIEAPSPAHTIQIHVQDLDDICDAHQLQMEDDDNMVDLCDFKDERYYSGGQRLLIHYHSHLNVKFSVNFIKAPECGEHVSLGLTGRTITVVRGAAVTGECRVSLPGRTFIHIFDTEFASRNCTNSGVELLTGASSDSLNHVVETVCPGEPKSKRLQLACASAAIILKPGVRSVTFNFKFHSLKTELFLLKHPHYCAPETSATD